MKRALCVALAFVLMAVVSQAFPFVGGDKEYNLGSTPQVGRSYQFDDELGSFTVMGYQEQGELLSLSFVSGNVKLEADGTSPGGPASACGLSTPYELTPSGSCAFKALRTDKKREYRLVVHWGFKVKKNMRVVVVRVKKTVLTLD